MIPSSFAIENHFSLLLSTTSSTTGNQLLPGNTKHFTSVKLHMYTSNQRLSNTLATAVILIVQCT